LKSAFSLLTDFALLLCRLEMFFVPAFYVVDRFEYGGVGVSFSFPASLFKEVLKGELGPHHSHNGCPSNTDKRDYDVF
jgi:hypothetical protein